MYNKISTFKNKTFGAIRTMTDERGDPWFVGKDVAEALGYSNSRKALQDHVDNDDRRDGVTIRDAIGRKQKVVFINESGLYCLILSSKLPSAKAFKRWVTGEVLPQIRRTGGYIPMKDSEGRMLSETEIMKRGMEIIGNTIALWNQQNADCLTATDVAERYGMDVISFNNLLQRMGVQYRKGGRWWLCETYQDKGLAKDRLHVSFALKGRPKMKEYLVWTPEGVAFLDAVTRRTGIGSMRYRELELQFSPYPLRTK